MMDDHSDSGHALLILGIKPKDKAAHGGVMSKEEKKHHGEMAMKEMHEAMQRGDHAGMSAAMRAHHAIHEDDGEEYDHEDGEDAEAMPEGPSVDEG
jgi:hypothetical protein